MNAVPEMHHFDQGSKSMTNELTIVNKYMPVPKGSMKAGPSNPDMILRMAAMPNVRDMDKYFKM